MVLAIFRALENFAKRALVSTAMQGVVLSPHTAACWVTKTRNEI
jgi:hypothetical protein